MADVPIRFVVLLLFGFILAIGWTVPTTGALERVEEESMLRDSALAAEIEACYRVQDAQYEWIRTHFNTIQRERHHIRLTQLKKGDRTP